MKVVLCSCDAYFMDVFSVFVKQQYPELMFFFFTEKEKAQAYVSAHGSEIDVVMGEDDFFRDYAADIRVRVIIGSQTLVDTEKEVQRLNIYQQGTDIISDLKKIVMCISGDSLEQRGFHGGKVAAFSSTQGGSGKTTIAYMTAVRAAKDRRTAYLNLEMAPYTDGLYQMYFDVSMEDILFAVKDKRNMAGILISGLKKNQDQVMVFPGIRSMGDYMDLTGEDMEYLIESLMGEGGISLLIVDLPFDFSERSRKVMDLSDRIFMVYTADDMGAGKQAAFEHDPARDGRLGADRIRYIQNKCPVRSQSGIYAMAFPFSQSISKGVALAAALDGNGDFTKGCDGLIKMI